MEIYVKLAVTALIIVCLAAYYFKNRKEKDEWDEALQKADKAVYDFILDLLIGIDASQYKNLDEFRSIVLIQVENSSWEIVRKTLDELIEKGEVPSGIRNYLTRDKVHDYIDKFVLRKDIDNLITSTYLNAEKDHIENPDDSLSFTNDDGETIDYSDPDQYNIDDEVTDPELEPAEEDEIPPEALAKLNPPSDDPSEDNEVWELSEDEVAAGVHFDKNGRKRDKNGRFTK